MTENKSEMRDQQEMKSKISAAVLERNRKAGRAVVGPCRVGLPGKALTAGIQSAPHPRPYTSLVEPQIIYAGCITGL